MIRLPPLPRGMSLQAQLEQWLDNVWQYIRPTVQLVRDVAATIGSGSTYVGMVTLTAPRTLTLPDAAEMQDGDEIVIQDESGNAGGQTITIATQGSDTVNGGASVTITSAYGRRRIIKRGTGAYFSA